MLPARLQLICYHSTGVFDSRIVDIGNIGLRVTKGTLGGLMCAIPQPAIRHGVPFEYRYRTPVRSGFLIGAEVDGQILVSTSAKDAASGYSTGGSGFEFTAEVGNTIAQRSSLTNSEFFSFDAISHEDMLMDFSDQNIIIPGTAITINEHTQPLNAQVHLESYAWNFHLQITLSSFAIPLPTAEHPPGRMYAPVCGAIWWCAM